MAGTASLLEFFSGRWAVVADQKIFHHLLGNRGAALRPARIGEIADEGADDAALVDAVMRIEAPVFGGDEGVAHGFGNVSERNPQTPVAGLEHIGEIPALPVQHQAHARQSLVFENVLIRQISGRSVEKIDHLPHVDDRIRDRLVLAELVIGGG